MSWRGCSASGSLTLRRLRTSPLTDPSHFGNGSLRSRIDTASMSISTTKKVMVGATAAAVVSLGTLAGFAAAEAVGGPTSTASTTTVASDPTTRTNPATTNEAG